MLENEDKGIRIGSYVTFLGASPKCLTEAA